ncbi:MAG TPA: nuclear transport factor 2 family protein [Sediminibacterium sp.]|nr:nuclear transport factor 2 family protein [Sediminibacterium sp.]
MQNKETITHFYTAFQHLDAAGMRSCYHPEAVFLDPVFGMLQGDQIGSMWQMLCKTATDFTLEFNNIQELDEEYCTTDWIAKYRFRATGRPVINKVRAYMRLADGLIIEHSDAFGFYTWSRQALGIPGWLFGWSNFMQSRVRRQALKNLTRFQQAATAA